MNSHLDHSFVGWGLSVKELMFRAERIYGIKTRWVKAFLGLGGGSHSL